MRRLRFLTSGESHGKALTGIIEGIPANLELSSAHINVELKRRQGGFGRGGRMQIETDHAEIISGVRWGKTIGSPVTLLVENRDHAHWLEGMSADAYASGSIPAVTRPRPGHADLAGAIKYGQYDLRNILERSSARETAMRTALGAVAKRFLNECGVFVGSFVVQVGGRSLPVDGEHAGKEDFMAAFQRAEASPVRCPDEKASAGMVAVIEEAMKQGNTVGGIFVVFATGVPVGLGSHVQWDRRLDGRLVQALMSIQAVKGVEVGSGFQMAGRFGAEAMDEIVYRDSEFGRTSNHAGGIEGGMTNGMSLVLKAGMKPIPTLRKPLKSVDIVTKEPYEAAYERSDFCAVPAASVIGEAMVALILADAFLEKFGGDSMEEFRRHYSSYREYLSAF